MANARTPFPTAANGASHDRQQLADAIFCIKARFQSLESKGAQLEQAVARSRTRLLGQIMTAREVNQKDADEHTSKPPLPKMPWSKPRLERRPVARIYAAAGQEARAAFRAGLPVTTTAKPAAGGRLMEQERKTSHVGRPRLESTSGSDTESDGGSDAASDDDKIWSALPSPAKSSADSCFNQDELDKVDGQEEQVHLDVSAAASPAACSDSCRRLCGRPDSFVQPSPRVLLQVQSDRPFSAPQLRREAKQPGARHVPSRPSTAGPSRPSAARPATAKVRPSTAGASVGRRPFMPRPTSAVAATGKPARPASAAAAVGREVKSRPRSAFGNLQRRPQTPVSWERPPNTAHYEPQGRWLSASTQHQI